jgi:uncharacterized protein (TIGR00730 family)
MNRASTSSTVIAVFGSAAPQPGSVDYDRAYGLGRLLAEAGYVVATDGYSGTMAAVSQGAHDAGGHVVGVTCGQIERFRPLGCNEWVKEEIKYDTLRERLLHLVTHNDGMVVLPGGIGTLSEMALAWSFLQTGEIQRRPLVLLGDMWRRTVEAFARPSYVPEMHQALLSFAETPAQAVTILKAGPAQAY